ncbi:MAG: hypothetical protein EKK55_25035 [Rhodocyclaceae bacterium]|nr:MAG: hypothetical protein EKK55_25035 [Rhodocyclaceae bacterium]
MLYFGDEWVGGVVRYRWGTGCHPYLKANGVDRDLVEPGQAPRSPGPAKHRVEAAARALLGQRRRG